MIKVDVNGRKFDVRFSYHRINKAEKTRGIPHDTYVEIYEENKPELVAKGTAWLHPKDLGKFRYKQGRAIALKYAVKDTGWDHADKQAFWQAIMPYIKD